MTQTTRLDRLQNELRTHGMDALVVAPGANMFYLTGIDFLAKLRLMLAIIPVNGEPALVVPTLEVGRASAQASLPLRHYAWGDGEGPTAALRQAMQDAGLHGRTVGIEHTVLRVFELRALEQTANVTTLDATTALAAMRMTKDARELAAMRAAVQVIEHTLQHTIDHMRVGMTEREVAAIWDGAINAAGSRLAFDSMVGSGPNGANPHHANGDRQLQHGDLVVLDGGAYIDGYASDITRTVAVGALAAEAEAVYELVRAANAEGRAAAALPGASGEAIDAAARAVITEGGYGPYFLHRTGHGLGIDVHEEPFIVAGSSAPLPIGATFTVEPGIYLEGQFGVRIEDDVVITETGAESLTSFGRELMTIR